MKYYICKPKAYKVDEKIAEGIRKTDKDAAFVELLDNADVCVMQKGWTKSKVCVKEYHKAREKGILRKEAYIYTDSYYAKVNNSRIENFVIKR